MKLLKSKLYISILSATLLSSLSYAETEVTGKLTIEHSSYTRNGSTIGDYGTTTMNTSGSSHMASTTSTPVHNTEEFKSEINGRIYIDGVLNESNGDTYHVELQAFSDPEAPGEYRDNESYTQRDALREAYVDTSLDDWLVRAGKQQVVWGTADGMKLLDMINPTDFSEMAQNQMEDSRIPVWMINADRALEDGGNFQFIVSQPRENIFPGLNRHISTGVRSNNAATMNDTTVNNGTDTGHAFMLKGPDTITGVHNGFLNIVPDLGSIAGRFDYAFDSDYDGTSNLNLGNLDNANMEGFTVGGFRSLTMGQMNHSLCMLTGASSATCTTNIATAGASDLTYIPYGFKSSINNVASNTGLTNHAITGEQMLSYGFQPLYNTNLVTSDSVDNSAFDYMDDTTFRTFDIFVNAKSQYVYNMPDNSDVDIAMRYKNTTKDGINYSFNFMHGFDKNPVINLSWRNDAGQLLTHATDYDSSSANGVQTTLGDLTDSAGTIYGGSTGNAATLRFEQELKKVTNVGGSMDMTIESEEFGPVVVRGEALYTHGSYSPVINKDRLSVGDLVGALQMERDDRFKFVLGADITAFTNMLVSGQLIYDKHLDFVDSGNRYTADYATMSMSNGFNKAIEDKKFYSLYFSKPFGESGEHRWNNITILEQGGGKWNRLDTEYTINDNTVATLEYNKYWGDADTQFGQLERSSNVQVGLKYSF